MYIGVLITLDFLIVKLSGTYAPTDLINQYGRHRVKQIKLSIVCIHQLYWVILAAAGERRKFLPLSILIPTFSLQARGAQCAMLASMTHNVLSSMHDSFLLLYAFYIPTPTSNLFS